MIPFLLGLFGSLFYFGNSEVRRFENLAAKDIRTKIHGEHSKVSVRTELSGIVGGPLGQLKKVTIRASNFDADGIPLFTQPGLSQKGTIDVLRIELDDFTLAGLRIQKLRADIPDCRYDYNLAITKRKIRLSRSGTGTGEVVIRELDLEAFILRKFGEIKKVTVRVANDKVHVEGYGEFLIIKAAFSVDAKLVAIDGTKLALDDATIYLDGKPADDVSRKALLSALNPVVDLSHDLRLYDAIKVDRVVLRDGVIRASGATKIPDQPVAQELSWLPILRHDRVFVGPWRACIASAQ
jgi:hypothetical protein